MSYNGKPVKNQMGYVYCLSDKDGKFMIGSASDDVEIEEVLGFCETLYQTCYNVINTLDASSPENAMQVLCVILSDYSVSDDRPFFICSHTKIQETFTIVHNLISKSLIR